jgi:hypothetical protein
VVYLLEFTPVLAVCEGALSKGDGVPFA